MDRDTVAHDFAMIARVDLARRDQRGRFARHRCDEERTRANFVLVYLFSRVLISVRSVPII
jgi:hypothetical protein